MTPAALQSVLEDIGRNRLKEASEICDEAIRQDPQDAVAIHLLGNIAHQSRKFTEAAGLYRRSIRLAEHIPQFHSNLGATLAAQGELAEAIECFRRSIDLDPAFVDGHRNLAVALAKAGRIPESLNVFQRALNMAPPDVDTLVDFNAVLQEEGCIGEMVSVLRRIVEAEPSNSSTHSDLLFFLHYDSQIGNDRRLLFAEHMQWRRLHSATRHSHGSSFCGLADRNRRIKVGFLSSNFRDHPVLRFVAPVLRCANRGLVELCAYSDGVEDEVSVRARGHADEWIRVSKLTDEQLLTRIREDRINVLIDLTGHMEQRRLRVFERRAAPVQVTAIGYPDTTGCSNMDYRITDAVQDPPGLADDTHSEVLIRMPRGCWCYDPTNLHPTGAKWLPEIDESDRDSITFGCLNRLVKVTPLMGSIWARILSLVPNSRLAILSDGSSSSSIVARFEKYGISPTRIEVASRRPRREFLEWVGQVDINLDTFPYNGHTTTLDALWMGVPTVSLCGNTHVSRAGLNILSRVGLDRLVVSTPDDYVREVCSLASNSTLRKELRKALRSRVATSELGDEESYAEDFTRMLLKVWNDWCFSTASRST